MTLHEDVARINAGDTVTAEITYYDSPYEITGRASKTSHGDMMLGPFALAFADTTGVYPNSRLLRVIDHQSAPEPLYTNRPDIKAPRPYDVVAAENQPGGEVMPLTYWNGAWRAHTGTMWTTEQLLEVGPLTLLATAQP